MFRERTEQLNLARCDIIGHVRDMRKNGNRFVITPNIKERANEETMDCLRCGSHCYALMCCRGETVDSFVLRMSPEKAKAYGANRAMPRAEAETGDGGDWYILNAGAFKDKREIYRLLDECYDAELLERYARNGSYYRIKILTTF